MKPTAKMRILLSAYACEPGKGSEPGVGWGLATHLTAYYDVWVITRANNRQAIETALRQSPCPHLHFVYFDLPRPILWFKKKFRCVRLYYYCWELMSIPFVRRQQRAFDFQICQHVTMVKYWAPSNLMALPIPFVWGPVGGGENLPPGFRRTLSFRSRIEETLRVLGRWLGEHDPCVRQTARKATIGIATTPETATRMATLTPRKVVCLPQIALNENEISLAAVAQSDTLSCRRLNPFRFICIGRLVGWKGFHFAIEAFMQLNAPDTELWIIGDGPERKRLQRLASGKGRIYFKGIQPREQVFALLSQSHVLLHPSLHDSGGLVCLEAMAVGIPVICLDTGGPSGLVSDACGVRVPVRSPMETRQALAEAMRRYATDPEHWQAHCRNATLHVRTHHLWDHRCKQLSALIQNIVTRFEKK